MVYYKKTDFKLIGYRKSKTKHKMYDAILEDKLTKKLHTVQFGDKRYQNYHDKTKLNLYPQLLHGDNKRRTLYRKRHLKDLRDGYYSPGYFSYHILW